MNAEIRSRSGDSAAAPVD